jgi:hypothetical protein
LIETDVPKLSKKGRRPIVFFITDGQPNFETSEVWREARAELLAPDFRLRPKLVAMGCGEVKRACLEEVASVPELAEWRSGPTAAAMKAILETVARTVITLTGNPEPMDDLAGRIYEFDYGPASDGVIEY